MTGGPTPMPSVRLRETPDIETGSEDYASALRALERIVRPLRLTAVVGSPVVWRADRCGE